MNREIKQYVLAGMFIALMAVSAWVKIPFPLVPLTFQLVVAVTAGIILGPKIAPLAMVVYLMLGLIGLPIFANGGGIGYAYTPTFGFILGFILSAWLSGLLWKKKSSMKVISILSGLISCYIIGVSWFSIITSMSLIKSVSIMAPFILKDIALGTILFGIIHVFNWQLEKREINNV